MQKVFGRTIFYFIMLTFLSSPSGYCAEQDPIKFLMDFYTWYIPAQGVMYPEYHRDIYLYVARDTVEELKKKGQQILGATGQTIFSSLVTRLLIWMV